MNSGVCFWCDTTMNRLTFDDDPILETDSEAGPIYRYGQNSKNYWIKFPEIFVYISLTWKSNKFVNLEMDLVSGSGSVSNVGVIENVKFLTKLVLN